MKRLIYVFMLVSLMFAQATLARPNSAAKGNCTNKNDVPGHFVNQCVLAGGTEVRCSSGTPMCCVKDSKGTRCYDTIKDVKRVPKANSGQPTPSQVKPPR